MRDPAGARRVRRSGDALPAHALDDEIGNALGDGFEIRVFQGRRAPSAPSERVTVHVWDVWNMMRASFMSRARRVP
jgi:hypothetical protein